MTKSQVLALITILTLSLMVLGNVKFGWYWRFQDWRLGRKIDETVEWKAFTAAFKDDK